MIRGTRHDKKINRSYTKQQQQQFIMIFYRLFTNRKRLFGLSTDDNIYFKILG